MFDSTVTVYNKHNEQWQRTVISGVFWNAVKGSVQRKTGAASADSLLLLIPFTASVNRSYLPPKQWQNATNKSLYFTLQSGDIVIKGDISYEIQKTSAELKNTYDDCLTISNVDTKDFSCDMSHWEVSAR